MQTTISTCKGLSLLANSEKTFEAVFEMYVSVTSLTHIVCVYF